MNEYQLLSLGQICTLIKDGTHGSHPRQKDGIPLISAKDVQDGRITISSDTSRISREEYETIHRAYEIKEDDLLISIVGSIGRCALVTRNHGTFSAQRSVGILRSERSKVDPKYLYHATCDDQFQQQLLSRSKSTAQAGVYLGELAQCTILLPPLPEQKKIAEILSGIDHLILATQRRIDRIRTAQVGLANSWQKQISLEKEDGTFGDLITSIDSGWSPACDEVPPKSGEWGVLKVSAVSKGYFCEEESKRLPANLQPRDQYRIKKNDVLITRANGNLDLVGRGAIVEEEPRANLLMSDKILRLNPNPSSDRNFLLLLLNSRHVRQQIETAVGGSTGAKNIGQSLLRQISTSVPISEDQAKIGKLSRSLSLTLSVGKKRLNYLVSLKKGLSSDLLSGRKRVTI